VSDKASDHWVIPLCVECHDELHHMGDIDFLEAYRHQIAEYFYDSVIGRLYDELRQRAKEMDCVCGNTDGDSSPMCMGADGGTCEEHTTGTEDMVAEPIGTENE